MTLKELSKIKQKADKGSSSDQYTYARANYWGSGIKQDLEEASKYYCKSASQGYALAIKGLQRMADQGYPSAITCQKSIQ